MKKRAFGGALLAVLLMISVAYGHYRQELSLRTAYVPSIAMNNTYTIGEDVCVTVNAPNDPVLDTVQKLTFTARWGQDTTGNITWQVQKGDAIENDIHVAAPENGSTVTLSIPQDAEPQAGTYQLVGTVWCQHGETVGETTLSIPFFVNYRTSLLRTGVTN